MDGAYLENFNWKGKGAATMLDDSNTQYLHPSNGEEELDVNNYIA